MSESNHQAYHFLVLPGWQNSGPQHWQSLWEREYGYTRVQQHDWEAPRVTDWIEALDAAVLVSHKPIVLLAHSLGCILVAAWAAKSPKRDAIRGKVKAAFLVAPGDVESKLPDAPDELFTSWLPIYRMPLPMTTVVIGSENDPFCRLGKAQSLARSWHAEFINAGAMGHMNADAGLGAWPQGRIWLDALLQRTI